MIKINEIIPQTKDFTVYKFKNPLTMKDMQILKCDAPACDRIFRKWHNFVEHLRVHTKEKPYVCTFDKCDKSFSQKTNLKKHLETHLQIKKFQCKECGKRFASF
jgi:uncharacterized Zn-finger protein